jgi:hypothetical protein
MTECNQESFEFEELFSRQVVARFDGGTISSDAGDYFCGRRSGGSGC